MDAQSCQVWGSGGSGGILASSLACGRSVWESAGGKARSRPSQHDNRQPTRVRAPHASLTRYGHR